MQGGIRRNKHDLLPRYNKNGELLDVNGNPTLSGKSSGGFKKKFRLTTPMKKVLIYITMLLSVYVFIQMTGIIARGGENPLLLSTTGASTTSDSSLSLGSGSGSSSSSSSSNNAGFKNDIAMQQEAANLKNEYDSSSSSSSSSGNAKDGKLSDDFKSGIVSNLVNSKDSSNEDSTANTKNGKANAKQQGTESSNAGGKVKAQDVAPKQQEQEQILGDPEQIDNGNDIKAVKQSDLQQKSGNAASGSSSTAEDGPRFKKSQGELNKQKDAKQKEESKQKNES
ncbi:hypothetical protein ACO0QE_001991 [Hanseniaspora vineae]